jgi:hypothetical protein
MSPLSPMELHPLLHPLLEIQLKIIFQPKAIMPRSWCNFCKEHHEETTCEVRKSARHKIFGKRIETTITILNFVEPKDVMIINTRNCYSGKSHLTIRLWVVG